MLSWFCRQSIAKKLAVGVGAQIVLLIAVCVISSLNSFSAEVSIDDLARRGDHKALVSRIEAEFSDARMFAWRTLATGETRSWADAGKSLNAAAADLSQLVSITHTAAKREKAQALLPVFEKYRKGLDALQRYKSFAEIGGDPAARELEENTSRDGETIAGMLPPVAGLYTEVADQTLGRGQGQRGFRVGADACAGYGRRRDGACPRGRSVSSAFAGRSTPSPPPPARSPAATSPSPSRTLRSATKSAKWRARSTC